MTRKQKVVFSIGWLSLAIIVLLLIVMVIAQTWRYTEAGKVPLKTGVILHAVNEQLLPEGLSTPSFFVNPVAPTIKRADLILETRDGEPIAMRLYTPTQSGPHPVILYFHGGAFMEGYGNVDTHDNILRALANRTNAIIVAPNYRLAPNYSFPTAIHDSFDALKWVYDEAKELDADTENIAVAGDSAGGNIAAAVVMKANEAGYSLKSSAFLYPLTTFEDTPFPSRDAYSSGYYFLSRSVMERARAAYTPNQDDWINPYVSPLLSDALRDFPTSLVVTAEFDPLRDEGEAFAEKLYDAGNDVEAVRFNGTMHGFLSFYEVMGRADYALSYVAHFFNRSFETDETSQKQPFYVKELDEGDTVQDEVEAYGMSVYLLWQKIVQLIK
ncbi:MULTISPECIES: alpha/beta hydrolase [Bacillaceae]|uniref:Lipase n=1 Tax=Alkalicoccobacillus plakortidis TaxID=444060 RepID=A0A9D5DRW3_9BACI|nr:MULTISPECIES: alpha/beta hydrolase [Bacillaceae]KQL51748.1 lipase [Alkalicoccobacillus plakortidis]